MFCARVIPPLLVAFGLVWRVAEVMYATLFGSERGE